MVARLWAGTTATHLSCDVRTSDETKQEGLSVVNRGPPLPSRPEQPQDLDSAATTPPPRT
eukprot:4296299-Prymnesium_polylepis.1